MPAVYTRERTGSLVMLAGFERYLAGEWSDIQLSIRFVRFDQSFQLSIGLLEQMNGILQGSQDGLEYQLSRTH